MDIIIKIRNRMINRLGLLIIFLLATILAEGQSFDTFSSPKMTDKMTLNPGQNKKWRKGLYKYSAKPKDAWELGIHSGHFMLDGDVDRRLPGGFGLGIHFRKAVHYIFSIRMDLFYGQAYGVDAQLSTHKDGGGALVEPVFEMYKNKVGWFPKVMTQYGYVSLQTIINIGNVLFHQERNRWNWYMVIGGGLDSHRANLDLLRRDLLPYDVSGILDKGLDHNIRSERIKIKKYVDNLYDGTYETPGFQKDGIFKVADKYNVHFVFTGAMGISRKMNKRMNISFEHQFMATDNDYLDGIRYRSSTDQSNDVDVGHYSSIRIGINLGNLRKRTEPLYWLNPLDATYNDIAELKQRPVLDITDSDGDGVVDMMDMEPNSPIGAKVDVRGTTMDSDGDGIPDYEDKEPYSISGYETDASGKAKLPIGDFITKEEAKILIDSIGDKIATQNVQVTGSPDWYLPMIHFDLDKYYIKPQFAGDLKHVAEMMKKFPELCITVYGYADSRNTDQYNVALSYKRANAAIQHLVDNYQIPRDRFNMMYGGEDNPLVPGLPDHHNITREMELKQYMNRRVEFRVCEEHDFNMAAPENIKAGKNTDGSSRKGPKYSGNKDSGY